MVTVLTGADLAADGVGNMPTDRTRKRRDGTAAFATPRPLLARERRELTQAFGTRAQKGRVTVGEQALELRVSRRGLLLNRIEGLEPGAFAKARRQLRVRCWF